MQKTFTLLFLFLFSFLNAQENPAADTSICCTVLPVDTLFPKPTAPDIDIAFGKVYRQNISGSIAKVTSENFNQGLLQHPLFSVQGRMAGVQITRPGGDPFAVPELRIRGLSSIYLLSQPLYVIDGIPGVPLTTVAPEDVVSVTVLKDAAQTAIYGESGAAGVVLVETKARQGGTIGSTYRLRKDPTQLVERSFSLSFQNKICVESVAAAPPVLDREGYLELRPDLDDGADTDWLRSVSRTAVSRVTGIDFATGRQRLQLRGSGYNRELEGVGKRTRGTNNFGNFNLRTDIFDNRMLIAEGGFFGEDLDSSFDQLETFRYATAYSPTAPVFADDGNYFEYQQFDLFNPRVIQDLSVTSKKRNNSVIYGKLDAKLRRFISGSFNYSVRKQRVREGIFISPENTFTGITSGLGKHFDERRVERNLEVKLKALFGSPIGNRFFDLSAGYHYRKIAKENILTTSSFFTQEFFTFENFNGFPTGANNSSNDEFKYNMPAFWSRVNFKTFRGVLSVSGSLRREGSSRLTPDTDKLMYKSGGVCLHIDRILKFANKNKLKARVAYGESGNFPEVFASRQIPVFLSNTLIIVVNGVATAFEFDDPASRFPDEVMRPEIKKELTAGVDFEFYFKKSRVTGSLSAFNNRIEDLIFPFRVERFSSFSVLLNNLDDIYLENKGLEFDLQFVRNGRKANYLSSFNMDYTYSSMQSTGNPGDFNFFRSEDNPVRVVLSSEPAGRGGGFPVSVIRLGDEFGTVNGFEYLETDTDGRPVYRDINEDGNIEIDDNVVLGNALPRWNVGWTQKIAWNNGWHLGLGLRGSYGHSLYNDVRQEFETNDLPDLQTNFLRTGLYNEEIKTRQQPNQNLVENAGFTAIDHFTIGRKICINNTVIRSLNIAFTLQNPFWLTNYTGNDPTPRYTDPYSTRADVPVLYEYEPLTPGLDRAAHYPRTRSFVFSLIAEM